MSTGAEGSDHETGWVAAAFRPPFAAVAFLTRIPAPRQLDWKPEDMARSTTWFPLVGVIVGAVGAAVYALATMAWHPLVAAVLSTAATVLLTGAFHEDALADSCDGLGGGWERAQVLSIMRDSRIGAYGTVGLTLTLLAKVAALTTLGEAGVGPVVSALVVAHVLGRWSSLPLMWALPYVGGEGARGRSFESSVSAPRLAAGTLMATVVVVAVMMPLGAAAVVAVLAVAAGVTLVGGRYFRHRLGGITGDCLGAANQLVELAVYLLLASRWILS